MKCNRTVVPYDQASQKDAFSSLWFPDWNGFNKIRYTIKKKKALREKTRILKCRKNAALEKNHFSLKTFIVYCKSCEGNNKLWHWPDIIQD